MYNINYPKVMKRLFFLCWIFLSYIDTFAQTHLSGRVVNEAGENVSFANVMVENASDSSFVTGTVTKRTARLRSSRLKIHCFMFHA